MIHVLGKNIVVTARELDVLRGVWAGHANKEIAHRLKISINTVELHRLHLNRKLNVHNTAGLLREGIKHKWIDPAT